MKALGIFLRNRNETFFSKVFRCGHKMEQRVQSSLVVLQQREAKQDQEGERTSSEEVNQRSKEVGVGVRVGHVLNQETWHIPVAFSSEAKFLPFLKTNAFPHLLLNLDLSFSLKTSLRKNVLFFRSNHTRHTLNRV